MGEEKPESEDGLGEHIKDSIGNDFSIDVDFARTISNTPYAAQRQQFSNELMVLKHTWDRRSRGSK